MSEGQTGQAESNIYTLLVIIATIVVAAATVYMAMRSQQLFGSWNPFSPTVS